MLLQEGNSLHIASATLNIVILVTDSSCLANTSRKQPMQCHSLNEIIKKKALQIYNVANTIIY